MIAHVITAKRAFLFAVAIVVFFMGYVILGFAAAQYPSITLRYSPIRMHVCQAVFSMGNSYWNPKLVADRFPGVTKDIIESPRSDDLIKLNAVFVLAMASQTNEDLLAAAAYFSRFDKEGTDPKLRSFAAFALKQIEMEQNIGHPANP